MRSVILLIGLLVAAQGWSQSPDSLLLKDFRPKSIYRIPQSQITKARFRVIDAHSHPYAETEQELALWVETQQKLGIEKTIVLTYATGQRFDSLVAVYGKFSQFDLWCGIDYTGYQEPGWSQKAIRELERCHANGAKGVGELGDKGKGLMYSYPTPAWGMHLDDSRMQPVLKRLGELRMPVNVHVAEPKWMYEPMDAHNDGLMNAFKWRIDLSQPDLLDHAQLIQTLENAVKNNPGTTFIACHFANCSYDLSILGDLLNKYPNLYADISARYGETAPIPRYMQQFYSQYQDRLLFGTDMGMDAEMYQLTFRILESADEHFYAPDHFNYHWPLHGFDLKDPILKKLYYENAQKILR